MGNHILKILITFSFLVATISYADVFNTLNCSGRIVNSDGSPKTGSVDLEINFFDSESGGLQKGTTYLFSATPLTNGTFNLEIVIADSDIPTILDSSTDTWIEVTDSTNSTVYPRQKLSSVPYTKSNTVKPSTFHWDGKELNLTDSCSEGQVLKYSSGSWGSPTASAGGTIGPSDIAPNAIEEDKIKDDAVTSAKIADDAVTSAKIADDAVTSAKIADDAVTSAKIADNSIMNADINSSANIAQSKINNLTTDLATINTNISAKEPSFTAGTTAQYFRGDKSWQTLDTDSVPEGTSKYYTAARARTDVIGSSITNGDTSSAPSSDAVYDALATRDASIATKADTSALSSKANTSTSISTGTGLTGGGDLSADRTISLNNTGVTPGSYTTANITVDAQGRITSATTGTGSSAAALPRSYISGLKIAKVDATTVSVGDGVARSSDNTTDLTLTGTGGLTNIDFTSDTGLNSVETLPSGAAWYSIWLVTDGTSTGLKAVKGSSAPAGYSAERRIAWVRVNSSSQIEDFACTRSSSTVNVCANPRVIYNITAGSATSSSALKNISGSVPPNTKIANITLFNRHNNDPTANFYPLPITSQTPKF